MKRCPTCNRTFTESHLSFCLDDGTPLVSVAEPADETTVVSPTSSHTQSGPAPTQPYGPRDFTTPAYVPPDSQAPGNSKKRRMWPWVVGILGVVLVAFVGLVIAAFIYLPQMMSDRMLSRNLENSNSNANAEPGNNNSLTPMPNSNAVAANENVNSNAEGSTTPTNHADVLSTLTDLEHDWTVANINADKKALERILADDYVAIVNGRSVGKVEYINTITRDTTTQDWSFEELKLDLKGTRATLSGIVKFKTADQEAAFRFVDKFVWRGGRWQATGSEISQVS